MATNKLIFEYIDEATEAALDISEEMARKGLHITDEAFELIPRIIIWAAYRKLQFPIYHKDAQMYDDARDYIMLKKKFGKRLVIPTRYPSCDAIVSRIASSNEHKYRNMDVLLMKFKEWVVSVEAMYSQDINFMTETALMSKIRKEDKKLWEKIGLAVQDFVSRPTAVVNNVAKKYNINQDYLIRAVRAYYDTETSVQFEIALTPNQQ